MGIEDIQISEELETNAPSIKYRGDEGPRSPQQEQQMMMAQLEEAYGQYVDEVIEMGQEPMSLQQFIEQAMAEGQMAGGPPLPNDPTEPVNPFGPKPMGPPLPNRQMAAYGGIMGIDGRRRYGLGSKFKKFVRKIIPNEVANIAVKAAPFVAPFNPALAGVMAGVGGFDQTGKIGSSIKSGLMNYGMGQLSRGIGGGMDNLQGMSFKVPGGSASGFGQYFSSPISNKGGLGKMFSDKFSTSGGIDPINRSMAGDPEANIYRQLGNLNDEVALTGDIASGGKKIVAEQSKNILGKDFKQIPKMIRDTLSKAGLGNNLMTGLLVGGLGVGAFTDNMTEDEIDTYRGEGLDIEGIRAEVLTAMKDPSGEALKAIRIKYPFLGRQDTKDIDAMGKAMGGRIGYMGGGMTMGDPRMMMPQSRMPMEEGGIMDLGGMEKDYRAEGGFVPIGKKEKADDVPARLSVNEFVFTADAVRNAGGGDIDRGAEVMENMMKNLEAGGQVSEESQGMQGAQQMFETSQRLSEVI